MDDATPSVAYSRLWLAWYFMLFCFVLALWPCFFAGIEDAARIGFGSSVLGQHVLLIAISNNFRESNNAAPEL